MATTSSTPVAPINFTSALPAMLDLLKYAGGTKTTQSEGGTQTTTSAQDQTATTQGQTGPLEEILAQLTGAGNLENLVASLFAQGAQQVPTLATAYANSTGTRVSNNSMLSSSLAQLNQTLAQSIANAIVQQQQTAVTAAGKLAETNKTQATKSTGTQETAKNLTTTQVVQPNVSPTKSLGLPTLAGTLLNQLGKQMKPAGASSATAGAPISMASGASIDVANQNFDYPDAFSQAQHSVASPMVVPTESLSFSPQVFAPSTPAGLDAGMELLSGASGGEEFIGSIDELFTAGSVATADAGGEFIGSIDEPLVEEGASFLDDILGGISNFFGFADGGRVGARKSGYADGGVVEKERTPVVRNIANFGQRKRVDGRDALNYSGVGSTGTGVGADVQDSSGAVAHLGGDSGTGAESSAFTSNTLNELDLAGVPALDPNATGNETSPSAFFAVVSALLAPSPLSIANAASVFTTGKTLMENFKQGSVEIRTPGETPDPSITGTAIPDGGEGGGAETINYEGNLSGGGGGGGAGEMPAINAFADGGKVQQKGKESTGVVKGQKGIDKVPIMATTDEYVLPVDVVQFIGKDNLDELVAFIHTPIRGGTRA